jgi:serine/threonine protein phosphatase PrpC
MDLTYAQLSIAGVRPKNEDTIGFWHPETAELIRSFGIAAVIADGVGGLGRGEIASQLAVHCALETLKNSPPDTPPADILRQIVNEANRSVYDAALQQKDKAKMATTFTASIFRNDELSAAHVGDTRIYLVRNGTIKRITSDHSSVSLQVKLGLATISSARHSVKATSSSNAPTASTRTSSMTNSATSPAIIRRTKPASASSPLLKSARPTTIFPSR